MDQEKTDLYSGWCQKLRSLSLLSTYSMRLVSSVILSDGLYALRVNR